jgi:hypothetical protein
VSAASIPAVDSGGQFYCPVNEVTLPDHSSG